MWASLVVTLGLVTACHAQAPARHAAPAPLPAVQVAPPIRGPIRQVGGQPTGQPPADYPKKDSDDVIGEPPGPAVLFTLDSEAALQERIRQEERRRAERKGDPVTRIVFPDEPVLSKTAYYGRNWPCQQLIVEPHYVCHGRLFFEEINAERYGWELGVLQPAVSTLAFFKDFLLLPMHMGTEPCRCYDCSAGKCLPGDPVPLILYPPEISLTGAAYEAAAIGTLLVMFP